MNCFDMIQPVFQFRGEEWVRIRALHSNKEVNEYIYKFYIINKKCEILSLHNLSIITQNGHSVCFHVKLNDNSRIYYRPTKTRLCLSSWKQTNLPNDFKLCGQKTVDGTEYHADHINTYGPNHLDNLQWLSASDHAKKTRQETKHNVRVTRKEYSIYVDDILMGHRHDRSIIGKKFGSAKEASRLLNIPLMKLQKSLRNELYCHGIKFRRPNLNKTKYMDEQWKAFANGFVSNKGRWKTAKGSISIGYAGQYKRKQSFNRYRRISIVVQGRRKQVYMHRAVWEAFKGHVPPGKVILHDDEKKTRDEGGYERNWLEDLRIGTQSENMSSYHRNKKHNRDK